MNPDVRRPAGPDMPEIVECVPNFSEGRRTEVVDTIAQAIASVPGVRVLDQEIDADHNRSVITFVGDRTSVAEAAVRGARRACELIDRNRHQGDHPRFGPLDALPFIPIAGVRMDDCVALARSVGKRIAEELQVPVYLYEAAATRPDRRSLPDVRRGEYEGLKKEIETNPDRKPDFGPPRLHPTAGACIVGARPVLIAWNVNLRTTDVGVAKRIAKAIRESDGGLPAVRAKGFELADRGLVQVSMNMVDYRKTSLFQAFEAIRGLATKEGVGSELAQLESRAKKIQARLEALIDEDARAYDAVMEAMRLPKSTEKEKAARVEAMQRAYRKATEVPLETMERCVEALELAEAAVKKGNRGAVTDAAVAVLLAESAIRGASLNCSINIASIRDEAFRTEAEERVEHLLKRADEIGHEAMAVVTSRL